MSLEDTQQSLSVFLDLINTIPLGNEQHDELEITEHDFYFLSCSPENRMLGSEASRHSHSVPQGAGNMASKSPVISLNQRRENKKTLEMVSTGNEDKRPLQ